MATNTLAQLRALQVVLDIGIAEGAVVPFTAEVHPLATITSSVVLGERVKVGRGVYLNKCVIGDDVIVEENTIIGYPRLTGWFSSNVHTAGGGLKYEELPPTEIGLRTLIRPNCLIYPGVRVGSDCWINFGVLLRERMTIGDHTAIGNLVASEGYTTIGSHCVIHAQSHLTAFMTIEDEVFVGPMVVTMNARSISYRRPLMEAKEQGPTIKRGVRIGGGAKIAPGVVIGENALIGAGTLITKNVPPGTVVASPGIRGKAIRKVPEKEWL